MPNLSDVHDLVIVVWRGSITARFESLSSYAIFLAQFNEDLASGEGVAFGYLAKALSQIAGELRFIQRWLWPRSNGTGDHDSLDISVERKAASLRFRGCRASISGWSSRWIMMA